MKLTIALRVLALAGMLGSGAVSFLAPSYSYAQEIDFHAVPENDPFQNNAESNTYRSNIDEFHYYYYDSQNLGRQPSPAEESMERANWEMVKWAAWQTAFVGIGTLLVFATLYLMIQANKSATKAAQSSELSVEVSRRIYEDQTRAFASFKFVEIIPSTEQKLGRFKLAVKNHGATPATILKLITVYKVFKKGDDIKISLNKKTDAPPHPQGLVFPGETEYVYMNAQLGASTIGIIKSGGSAHVAGYLLYRDAFGKHRRTIFHTRCDAVEGIHNNISFQPHYKHNKAS